MVDFHFIFIALFYLVAILFIHIQLKKSISHEQPVPSKSILTTKPLQNRTVEQTISEHIGMDDLEQYDNFKSIADNEGPDLTDEWSKVYEGSQMTMKEETVQNKMSTLDPEYQKTSLLDENTEMNLDSLNINPFDEFDTTSYLSFAPTN
jgi:hypothetical protein